MKEGWKSIQFECCLEKVPNTPKIPASSYKDVGKYPIVSQEDVLISGYWDESSDVLRIQHPIIAFGEHTRAIKYIDFNFVIGADGVKVLSPISKLNPKFFYYYLRWCRIPSLGYSRHYKLLKELYVPIPLLSEQERIVAELDLLTGVIEKQKRQLKELDTLAQSIFYDMFGNPIENEKGWKKNSIGSFANCIAGATPSTAIESYWNNAEIPWLSSGEVTNGRIYETQKKISKLGYDNCSTKIIPSHSVLVALAGQGKTRGTVGVTEIPLCTNQSVCSIITNSSVDTDFLYYQLKLMYEELRKISNGDGGRGGLNLRIINKFKVILPPIKMQKSFANKVSLVEKQKETITQSIIESQTLLDYTKDKYFG